MGRVLNKVAVVTGAASGLGYATALRLAEEGAKVILTDLDRSAGEKAAASIQGSVFKQLNVSSEAEWMALVDTVVREFGRLDVLVNNAGVVKLASVEDTTEQIWRQVNSVGTDGTFFGCKHAVRVMKVTGGGSIINMSSTAGIMGAPNVFAYAASKGAIRSMSKSVACYSTQNSLHIRCNSVHPGNMETPMLRGVQATVALEHPEAAAALDDLSCGNPRDVANMVLFLASDESRYVNGAELVVDNTVTITEGVVSASAVPPLPV